MTAAILAYKFFESNPRVIWYANCLRTKGLNVDSFCLGQNGQPKKIELNGVKINRIQKRSRNEKNKFIYLFRTMNFGLRAMFVLAWNCLLKKYKYVIVFSVPETLVFSALVPKMFGIPVILDFYDLVPEFYAMKFHNGEKSSIFSMLKLMEKLSCSFADFVISSNHLWEERLISRSVNKDKIDTITYCSDTSIFYPREKKRKENKQLLIYPGTLNWHQGVDIAIMAMKEISVNFDNVEFHIYGDGPQKKNLIELIEELGLQKIVFLHDMVPAVKIAEIIADADLLIVPKRASSLFGNEACSTKILDCMHMNIPVVASDTKVERYYFNDEVIKFFKSENPSSLAGAVTEVLRDELFQKQLVNNARKHLEYMSETRERDKLLAILSFVDKNKKIHFNSQ